MKRSVLNAAAVALLAAQLLLAAPTAAKYSSTNYCIWTGLIYAPYTPSDDFYNVAITLPTSCDDPRLDKSLVAQCKACSLPKTRRDCLARTAQEWHGGTDVESCTWVSRNTQGFTTRELNFTLGTNDPFMYASRVDQSMCYTVRDYEITSPPWAYSAAYFQSYGEGMVGGKTRIPDGWRPEVSCVVRAPDTRCRLTYKHTPDVQWQISQRDIYTTNETIINRITAPGNYEECIVKNSNKCVGADPPFRYSIKLTSIPCARGKGPDSLVRSQGEFPLAQPGWLLFPKKTVNPLREKAFFLEGLSEFSWKINALGNKQVLSMVSPANVILSVCPPPRYDDTVCAYTYYLDTPGYLPTVCYNNNDVFIVTYPLFTTHPYIDQNETPTQTIRFLLEGRK